MRIVFDTNVLFAAFTARVGFCVRILEQSVEDHEVFISQHIYAELARHLSGKSKLTPTDVEAALESLRESTVPVDPSEIAGHACRDPNDLPILGTAVAASATALVTGDKDLLTLGSFQGIPILSPRQFHDQFLSGG